MLKSRTPEGEQRNSGRREPLSTIDVSSRNAMEWSHASSLDR
jgi:hypothetical protein